MTEEITNAVKIEIGKLNIQTGDLLIVGFEDWHTAQARTEIMDELQKFLPAGSTLVVVGGGMRFAVVRSREVASLNIKFVDESSGNEIVDSFFTA